MLADASGGYDVVIVGGAVTGSSIAYHLAADPAFDGRILVLEKDPSYQLCATALSAGSVRQQFSTRINIELARYNIAFLRGVGEALAVEGDQPDIQLHEGGYLFLASAEGAAVLRENHALQRDLGADVIHFDAAGLAARFPWLATGDLAAGCWGRSEEGWFDGYSLMQAFRRKARSLSVEYRAAQAVRLERAGHHVVAVHLDDGTRIACGAVVNAAGTGAAALALSAGVDIPVVSKKRMVFSFDCKTALPDCPLIVDPSGVYVRPEGRGFICGSAPPADRDPDTGDFDVDHSLFEEMIWPILAARIPAFEEIRPGRAWAGHYDMNLFDHNVIAGRADGFENFYLANGFSGHGLQQSPAIGRGLAELIVHGRYRLIDLSSLSHARIAAGRPVLEKNIV